MTPPRRSWSRSSNAAAGCWTAPAGTMSCLAPVGTAASYATSGSAGSECWPASDPSARTVSGDGCPVYRPATHGTPPALKRGPDIPQSRRLTLLTSDRAATHRRLRRSRFLYAIGHQQTPARPSHGQQVRRLNASQIPQGLDHPLNITPRSKWILITPHAHTYLRHVGKDQQQAETKDPA